MNKPSTAGLKEIELIYIHNSACQDNKRPDLFIRGVDPKEFKYGFYRNFYWFERKR